MICPLLRTCTQKVSLEHYKEKCTNLTEDKFKECSTYQKLAGGEKTPLEWQKLLAST